MTRLIFVVLAFTFQLVLNGPAPAPGNAFKPYTEGLSGSDLGILMQPIPGSPGSGIDSFWMSAHEITWDLYDQFLFRENDHVPGGLAGTEVRMDIDGISGATTPYIDMSNGMGKKGYPVVNVTQYAASTFCAWLSAKTGRFYRLPTETEWEHACSAGSKGKYSFGNRMKELGDHAWYADNSAGKSQPVGTRRPNGWGLYDMHGNAAEWVIPDDIHLADQSLIPLYPRKLKGGSWEDGADALTTRSHKLSEKRWKMHDPQMPKSLWWFTSAPFAGFRIVRPLHTPADYQNWWVHPVKEFD